MNSKADNAVSQDTTLGPASEVLDDAFSGMVKRLAKNGDMIVQELDGSKAHILHMAVGIAGEAAELLEAFYVPRNLQNVELDMNNVIEELGDMEFYVEGLWQGIPANELVNINLSTVMGVSFKPLHDTLSFPTVEAHPVIERLHEIVVMAGTVLDNVKKMVIYQKPEMMHSIGTSLAALMWYMESLYRALNLNRDAVIIANMNKLNKRYGHTYSNESAQARADKAVAFEPAEALVHHDEAPFPDAPESTEEGTEQLMKPVLVYAMDDFEWWASRGDAQQALQEYISYCGIDASDIEGEPELLTPQQMEEMQYVDYDTGTRIQMSFRERLDQMIIQGQDFPTMFACTEC